MKNRKRVTVDRENLHFYWMPRSVGKIRKPMAIKTVEQKVVVLNSLGWKVSFSQSSDLRWSGSMENGGCQVYNRYLVYDIHTLLDAFIKVALDE
jgi:hypothetical protein